MNKGKVIVQLFGGLGNQMFIYATGKALALRNGSEFIIDHKSGFIGDVYKRTFELNNFKISAKLAPNIYSFNYKFGGYIRLISNKIKRHLPFLTIKIIEESNSKFNDDLITGNNTNCFLKGYWQTEDYFKDCSDIIRSEFLFSKKMSNSVLNEASIIDSYDGRSVALGVRRYQEVKTFVNVKLTDKQYYLSSMKKISEKIKNPIFFCFTQDQEWVKTNLCNHGFEILFMEEKNIENGAIEDLFLLKRCKNFIISNSTFYWWGAWLSENKNKIVITPSNWVNKLTVCNSWNNI